MGEDHDPGCAGYEPDETDLCRYPGCGQRWTTEFEMEDGWCAFLCDDHADGFSDSDPVHGQVVSVNVWGGMEEAWDAIVAPQAAGQARLEQVIVVRNPAARRRSTRAVRCRR